MKKIIQGSQINEQKDNKVEEILVLDERFRQQIEISSKKKYIPGMFFKLVQDLRSQDIGRKHSGLIGIRRLLSGADPLNMIQIVIDSGIVSVLIAYAKQEEYPQLQQESTWALTNIASGTSNQCQLIIDGGGIPLLLQILNSRHYSIVEQAIWALGNIASDNFGFRNSIIENGGVQKLIFATETLKDHQNIFKVGCWALSSLCRSHPLPKYEEVKAAILFFCENLNQKQISDKQILSDICWAISFHSGSNESIINSTLNIISKIISNLTTDLLSLVIPSIRIIKNILGGTEHQINCLLQYDILASLEILLDHHKKAVRRQVSETIEMITEGNPTQIEAVKNRHTLIQKVLNLFATDSLDVQKVICFILSNLYCGGDSTKPFEFENSSSLIQTYVILFDI